MIVLNFDIDTTYLSNKKYEYDRLFIGKFATPFMKKTRRTETPDFEKLRIVRGRKRNK